MLIRMFQAVIDRVLTPGEPRCEWRNLSEAEMEAERKASEERERAMWRRKMN